MIKIVGNDETVVKRCTCKNCSSILEYTMSDTVTDYYTDHLRSREYFKYILCPKCNYQIVVKTDV
jgi:hypothetical protein